MDAAFDHAQALYDAAQPDDEPTEPEPIHRLFEGFVDTLWQAGLLDNDSEIHRLSDRQATVGVWIDGHEYSLTLNRED